MRFSISRRMQILKRFVPVIEVLHSLYILINSWTHQLVTFLAWLVTIMITNCKYQDIVHQCIIIHTIYMQSDDYSIHETSLYSMLWIIKSFSLVPIVSTIFYQTKAHFPQLNLKNRTMVDKLFLNFSFSRLVCSCCNASMNYNDCVSCHEIFCLKKFLHSIVPSDFAHNSEQVSCKRIWKKLWRLPKSKFCNNSWIEILLNILVLMSLAWWHLVQENQDQLHIRV